MVDTESTAAPAWGPQSTAIAYYDDFVPILLGGVPALLEGLLKRHKRDIAFAALGGILVASAWLLWPVLFSMRLDGTTSMSWSTVWIPLWIATFIGLAFFIYLVSWGRIKAPPGWRGEWRDPYPLPMRMIALVKWCLLLLFQVFLVRRLDGHNSSWTWAEVLAPLMAWIFLRCIGELCRIVLQKKRLMMGRIVAAAKVIGEATMLFLQVLFLMWRLDDQVDWSWWAVFTPLWLLHLGQLVSWGASQALAMSLVRRLEDNEGATEEQRKGMEEAGLLMDNAKHLRQSFGLTLVTSVLAAYKASGGNFSAFFVFLPTFLAAAHLTVVTLAFLVCYGSHRARQQEERRLQAGGGLNTDV